MTARCPAPYRRNERRLAPTSEGDHHDDTTDQISVDCRSTDAQTSEGNRASDDDSANSTLPSHAQMRRRRGADNTISVARTKVPEQPDTADSAYSIPTHHAWTRSHWVTDDTMSVAPGDATSVEEFSLAVIGVGAETQQ